jgi:predicted NAD-dependent protein-ADP-ribosyltransferase YbiA (DUF1768 family)
MTTILEIDETGDYSCLNNFTNTPFTDSQGVSFNSLINAYYYYLFNGNRTIQKSIRFAKSSEEIVNIIGYDLFSELGKPLKHTKYFDLNWTQDLLSWLITQKLNENSICVDALLATWGKKIIVINRHDNVLGAGAARTGLNLTGTILMELREQFRIIRQTAYLESLKMDDIYEEDPIC